MFAMGLPGGMRELAPVDETVHDGADAPEISVGSSVDLDAVVIELRAAANAASSRPAADMIAADDAPQLPAEEAELGFAPPMAMAASAAGATGGGKRLPLATLASVMVHCAAFAMALHVARILPEAPVEEGSTVVSVIMVGNGDVDAAASGREPEEIHAEPVPVETATAASAEPLKASVPEAVPLQAAEPVTPASPAPEAVPAASVADAVPAPAAPTPPVLAAAPTQAVSPDAVAPAPAVSAPEAVPAQAASPLAAEAVTPQPSAPPVEQTEPLTPTAVPTETITATLDDPAFDIDAPVPVQSPWKTEPLPEDQVAAHKAAERKVVEQKAAERPKPVAKRPPAGSSGQASRDQRKGVSSGTAEKGAVSAAKAQAGKSGNGAAEMANYTGRLSAKLRRSVAVERYYHGNGPLQANVTVNVTLNRSGSIASVSLGKSSGNSKVDAIVLQRARAAGPFGPFPASFSAASHRFSLPIQLNLRR